MTKNHTRQHFTQTPLPILRNFKCWKHEVQLLLIRVNKEISEMPDMVIEMYYNGGYSPKMFINEILSIPVDVDIFSNAKPS